LAQPNRDLLLYCSAKGPDTDDFYDLNAVAERLLDFQYYWETTGRPFEWKFTRKDLSELLAKLGSRAAPKIR